MTVNRSQKIILTGESRALKDLRVALGLSLRQVGNQIGMSHTYIAHIEAGRMAVPAKSTLMKILEVYGVDDFRVFYDKARNMRDVMTVRQELSELVDRFPEQRVTLLLKFAQAMAEGRLAMSI